MNILTAAAIGIRQPEPPEGRRAYQLSPLIFASGSEVFSWDSNALGNAAPSAIMSAWVDATNLPSTDNLIITMSNNLQTFKIQGGTQGYIVITAQKPAKFSFSITGGSGVTLTVVMYNYNALFTGSVTTSSDSAAPSNSGSGGGGTGGSTPAGSAPNRGANRAAFLNPTS